MPKNKVEKITFALTMAGHLYDKVCAYAKQDGITPVQWVINAVTKQVISREGEK